MIIITRHKSGISIKGHAEYDVIGKDIVCASISTLVQVLIQSIEELTADKIKYCMLPGSVDIKHGDLSKQAQLLVNSFFVGCEMIADQYPKNVLCKH